MMKISKRLLSKSTINDSFNVSKGLIIHGNIEGSVCGRIEGQVFGNIELEGKVIIAEDALVSGYVIGSEVVVNGTVKGNIICKGQLSVGDKGDISGDVLSIAFSVSGKASIKGTIRKSEAISEEDIHSVKINALPKISSALKAIVKEVKENDTVAREAWW